MQLFDFQGWGDHQSTLDETGKIRRNTYQEQKRDWLREMKFRVQFFTKGNQ